VSKVKTKELFATAIKFQHQKNKTNARLDSIFRHQKFVTFTLEKKSSSNISYLTKFNPKSKHLFGIGNTYFVKFVMPKCLGGHTQIWIQEPKCSLIMMVDLQTLKTKWNDSGKKYFLHLQL
jgi:hypothetical protein